MKLNLRFALFALLFTVSVFSYAQSDVVQINELRVNEPIPGQSVAAGYFSLANSSEEVVTLLRVEANFADRVELHQTMNMNGMNQMRPLQSVHIEPGQAVLFEPGGRHLMLMGITRPDEQTAELTFYFDNDLVITRSVEWSQW